MQAWNHIATGMGGVDLLALPAVMELLGIPESETELMMHLLHIVKTHKPSAAGAG